MTRYHETTDEEIVKLVRAIKISSEQNGVFILKSLRNSIKKTLMFRRLRPKFQRVQYKWLKPEAI